MKKFEYFLVGVFAALGALLLEIILDSLRNPLGLLGNWELFFLAIFVLVEESAKFIVILKKISLADSVSRIILHCLWIGAGFGILELSILFSSQTITYTQNILPILSLLLVHILTTALIGLALIKFNTRSHLRALAILPALLLHLAFNYWVFTH
jgi:hypothetical protein